MRSARVVATSPPEHGFGGIRTDNIVGVGTNPCDAVPLWSERHRDLIAVLESAAALQRSVPDAVLVGGSVAAMDAGHRLSSDHDHVLTDLMSRYEAVLEAAEATEGWATSVKASRPPMTLMGSLGGIEAGLRQLRRSVPLQTVQVRVPSGERVTVPTLAEALRVKAYLVVVRNQVRDYLDVAAMAERLGMAEAAAVLGGIDGYTSTAPRRTTRWRRCWFNASPSQTPRTTTSSGGCPTTRDSPGSGRSGLPSQRRATTWPKECWRDPLNERQFRNVAADPDDDVDSWPYEALVTALERGGLHEWQRIAAAINAQPWGVVARAVEAYLAYERPYGLAPLMERAITSARSSAENEEKSAVAARITELVSSSGLTRVAFAAAIGTCLRACPRTAPAR